MTKADLSIFDEVTRHSPKRARAVNRQSILNDKRKDDFESQLLPEVSYSTFNQNIPCFK